MAILSSSKVKSSPIVPAVLIISVLFLFQKYGLAILPRFPSFVQVDTISEKNWTEIAVPSLSLTRVHRSNILHHKVWVLPFDEMWQLGLSAMPATCAGSFTPIETHVLSGTSVFSAAMEMGRRMRQKRRTMALLPLGRPFILSGADDRELVHAFALPMEGMFPRRSNKWFARVVKAVDVVRESSEEGGGAKMFCSEERAVWMKRAVAYAVQRFKKKGMVPKSNPMDEARAGEEICCREDVDKTEDLRGCGVACNTQGVFNIIKLFPERR